MVLFMVLICEVFQILFYFFFSLVVIFNFFISLVLLLCMDLICSQVHILTSECCYGTYCNWPESIVQISKMRR
jgi:hypothetical protein